MACNRETSADGSTSSAPPACQNSEALVPCCNNNCHFFGCAATLNLCSRCYSEHILKEGSGVFLDKSSDASVDAPIVSDPILERSEEASPPAMPANDQSVLRNQNSKDNSMNRSAGVSDLHAIFRSVQSSDLPQQRIPSPLSLPSRPKSPRAFSPIRRQVEINKVSSMPPLPPRQQAVSRCLACRKRVGLLGFKCRCGDIFCALHRYSDKHDCSFDYKAAGRAVIAKENPVVKASKIERI